MRQLILLLILFSLAACAPAPKNAQLKPEQNALLTGNTWEMNRGVMLAGERSKNYTVAITAGEQELEIRPDNHEARILLARMQCRAGRVKQALKNLESLPPDVQATPECRLEKTRALIANNSPRAALDCADGMMEPQAPLRREFAKLQAVALSLLGRHAAAQTAFEDLLAEREDGDVRYNLGRSLVTTGDFARAASVLAPLVDDPDYPQARVLAAGSLMKSGNREQARNLLEGYLSDKQIDSLLREGGAL